MIEAEPRFTVLTCEAQSAMIHNYPCAGQIVPLQHCFCAVRGQPFDKPASTREHSFDEFGF